VGEGDYAGGAILGHRWRGEPAETLNEVPGEPVLEITDAPTE
jgi:hypothetical protein